MLPTEIRQSVRSLHEEQHKIFDVVANFAHQFLRGSNPTPPLIIVQGEEGTGKTKLINSIMEYVSSIVASGGSELEKTKSIGCSSDKNGRFACERPYVTLNVPAQFRG